MVRRRSIKPKVTMPAWVGAFVPSAWPGETTVSRWLAWRTAVTEFCSTSRLLSLDFSTWLDVKNNVYRVRNEIWQDDSEQYRSAARISEELRKDSKSVSV